MDFTFDPMTNNSMCVVVPIVDDMVVENRELFSCTLTTSDPDVDLNPQNATVYIADDDCEFLPLTACGPNNFLSGNFIPTDAIIQPRDPTYDADEMIPDMQDFLVPIVIANGSIEAGQECTVMVHTVDGTAEGELLGPHSTLHDINFVCHHLDRWFGLYSCLGKSYVQF